MAGKIKLSLISLASNDILSMKILDDDRDITIGRAKAEMAKQYPYSEHASYFELTRMSERWGQMDKEEKNR